MDSTVASSIAAALEGVVGRTIRQVQYWHPGSRLATGETLRPAQSERHNEPFHIVDFGLVLVLDAGHIGFCWRMDGNNEWLGLQPPWEANPAMRDYWVHDATLFWRSVGMLTGQILGTDVWSYPTTEPVPEPPMQVVGVLLRTTDAEVAITTADSADSDSELLVPSADSLAVIFDSRAASTFVSSCGWVHTRGPGRPARESV